MQEIIKYLFIVNNGSGRNAGVSWKDTIEDFFKDKHEIFQIYILPERLEVKQIKDHILKVNPQCAIAVGGDGTVAMLANILENTDIALGILPAGSANGMAKELGISEKPGEALKIITEGVVKQIDLIKIDDAKYCLHLSDIGLNAQLIKHFEDGNVRGKLGYALVLLKTLWRKHRLTVAITTDTGIIKRTALMVAFANASKYGTGAVINPKGKLDDGLFEVIIIKKLSLDTIFKMLLNPGAFSSEKIEIIPSKAVTVNMRRKMHFQIDGEYQGKITHVSAKICAGVLKIITPN